MILPQPVWRLWCSAFLGYYLCFAQCTPSSFTSPHHQHYCIMSCLFHHKHILLSQGNSAHELGGALYSIQPSISIEDRAALNVAHNVFTIGDLYLDMVNMTLNSASQGGCMYVTGNGANVTAVNSYFDRSGSGTLWYACLRLYARRLLIESAETGLLTAALTSTAQECNV